MKLLNKAPLEKTGLIPGPPIFSALCVTVISLIIIHLTDYIVLTEFKFSLVIWQKTLIFLTLSIILSHPFKLPSWWIYIFLIFSGLFMLMNNQQVPIWLYPTLIVILGIINWNSFGDRVPLFLTNSQTIDGLSLLIDNCKKKGVFYDLGCGTCSALIPLARIYSEQKFIGVETAPVPFLISKIRIHISGLNNIEIHRKSIWDTDIKDANIIYAFLSPHPMNRLLYKCQNELDKGATLVSNSFDSIERPAEEMIEVFDRRQTKLLIWQF